MISFINSLLTWIMVFGQDVFAYFSRSPISSVFFTFIVFILAMNIFEKFLIQIEKKQEILIRRCKYLDTDNIKQCCTSQAYEEFFKKNGDNCAGCHGRYVVINNSEIEELIGQRSAWKHIIIFLANVCRNLLPYITFFYTLVLAIFENDV